MITKEVLMAVFNAPLKELEAIFRVLVKKIYTHRKANKGFVPREVFEPCLGMSGVNTCVQIVNEVVDDNGKRVGFALKKRESSETGDAWADLYHSTCCTMRMTDIPEDALGRNTKETFGFILEEKLEFLGVTIHSEEAERWSSCVTIMHRRKVKKENVAKFVGEWKIFSELDIYRHHKEIIEHNCFLLEWVMQENRPRFADVRGGWVRKP